MTTPRHTSLELERSCQSWLWWWWCRENILKTAKALVEDTKTLVAGAASNQEQLAGAAQSAVMTITRLADCVKHGAASLGSEQPEAQV